MAFDPDNGTLWGIPILTLLAAFIAFLFLFFVLFIAVNMVIKWYNRRFKSEQFVVTSVDDDEWHSPDKSSEAGMKSMATRIVNESSGNLGMRMVRLKKKNEENGGKQ